MVFLSFEMVFGIRHRKLFQRLFASMLSLKIWCYMTAAFYWNGYLLIKKLNENLCRLWYDRNVIIGTKFFCYIESHIIFWWIQKFFSTKISAVLLCNAEVLVWEKHFETIGSSKFCLWKKVVKGSVYFEKKSEVFERNLSVFDNDVIVVCLRCESD